MSIATKTTLGDFETEFLGLESSSCFQGFGCAFTPFRYCTYGIGDTEEEALDDCLEMLAQSANFDWTDEIEKRIREEYGECSTVTVAEELGWTNEEEVNDSGEGCYFHVGIRWNEKE